MSVPLLSRSVVTVGHGYGGVAAGAPFAAVASLTFSAVILAAIDFRSETRGAPSGG